MLFGLSIRNRMPFVPFFSETLPAFAQARKRRSGLPSAAMLVDSSPLSTSIGVHGPSLSRYESFAWTGLARTQSSYSPAEGAVNRYDASPGWSWKLLIKSPPESWSRLTWSYQYGCRCIVDFVGFSPSTQIHAAARAARRPVRQGRAQAHDSGNQNGVALDVIVDLVSSGFPGYFLFPY